jgi:Domain of unknown function (DUF4062)/Tetratricopeptide repeat
MRWLGHRVRADLGGWVMAKVYVSSTIVDLKQERQAVVDWLRAARHQAVDSYLPDSDSVRDSCLEDVGTCDLYVLILGHRYGFQPADGNPEGLSITDLEFRRAGQCGIPRIALVRTSIPDVRLSEMENPERAALVLAFREEVAREVRPAEFSDLQGLVQGLSTGVQAELGKRSAGAAGAGRALRLALPPALLAGREDVLAVLDDRLAGGQGQGPRIVALHGLAGVGKTSVALAYAHRHLAEAGVAWQLPAEDQTVLAAGFGELAAQLGVREEAGDPVASVHAILAAYPAGWLLIFDNAAGPESVAGFVPPTGDGRVLITSRNALWPPGPAVEVPVLDVGAAASFLAARTGDPDHQAAAGLAEALGGLPLALEQAAAYIQATGGGLTAFLALFRQRRQDLLARGQPAGYTGTVAATWTLAFTQMEHSDPAAAGLLRLLAFCAPEAVPLRLLLQPRPGLAEQLSPEVAGVLVSLLQDELVAWDAIAALRRYSLITTAAGGAVWVHRLVQAVTLDQMPAKLRDEWRQAAAAMIGAAIPPDGAQADAWPDFTALLPHAQAALTADSDGMERIGSYLGHSGNYMAARDLYCRVAEAWATVRGQEHPDALTARIKLAFWTGLAGDPGSARDQVAALLPVCDRILGSQHPDTLLARSNLARWTGDAGDPAAARDQCAALLPVCDRVLGPEHLRTVGVRLLLARWTGEAGDPATARDQFAALLPVRERVSGVEHMDTLSMRIDLAYWTGTAGDPAGARDQCAALLPVIDRVLGPEHPDTLTTRHNLARWTGDAGHPGTARDQFAVLLPIYEQVFGPEHSETLTVRALLARWTGAAGDAATARDQYAALLPIHARVLGPEHPLTLDIGQGLARWMGAAGDAATARDQYAALVPIRERVLGPEHPDTLVARDHLARWTGYAGDPAGARDQYAALLPMIGRVSGPEHQYTIGIREGLAAWTGGAGDPATARDQYAALLPIRERVSGPDHPHTLDTRADLASWTGEAGDAAAARDQYAALLPLVERVLGPEHPHTLGIRNDLAYWTEKADSTEGHSEN